MKFSKADPVNMHWFLLFKQSDGHQEKFSMIFSTTSSLTETVGHDASAKE